MKIVVGYLRFVTTWTRDLVIFRLTSSPGETFARSFRVYGGAADASPDTREKGLSKGAESFDRCPN